MEKFARFVSSASIESAIYEQPMQLTKNNTTIIFDSMDCIL